MAREKKSRLTWFSLDVDAFLESKRMLRFNDHEKGQIALLFIKMWHKGAEIPDDVAVIANLLSMRKNEAINLRQKLIENEILVMDADHNLFSPRLKQEREIAFAAYSQRVEAGKKSAEAKQKRIEELQNELGKVNGRSTVVATLVQHNKN